MTAASDIRKLMSCTAAEFAASMVNIGGMTERSDGSWTGLVGGGTALVRYQPQPGVRLGGLLEIPRAVVTISLSGVSVADRATLLRQFEMAFQRGGG